MSESNTTRNMASILPNLYYEDYGVQSSLITQRTISLDECQDSSCCSSVHTTTSRYEPNKDINQVNRYQLQDKENHKNTIAGSMLQYEQLIMDLEIVVDTYEGSFLFEGALVLYLPFQTSLHLQ
ncbi:unnamed protein product [Rhizophagus irregularis]|uniref:Uncharacterized protein n=1 Tax=Rhizophagus irregularis TaxID=588596 RepID=A0A915ZQQ8_9GLOM|nr:unnamed protein product [Rhizophagus irregularis]